jgi:hypothetical protein
MRNLAWQLGGYGQAYGQRLSRAGRSVVRIHPLKGVRPVPPVSLAGPVAIFCRGTF